MANKVIKQILLKFYDNERDKVAADLLEDQFNASEYMRQVLADIANGKLIYADELELPLQHEDLDQELRKQVEFHSQVIQNIIAAGLSATTADAQPAPKPISIAPSPKAFSKAKTTGPPPEEGKSDGRSANNLLDSLNNF